MSDGMEDHVEEGWTPERERQADPAELQKRAMRLLDQYEKHAERINAEMTAYPPAPINQYPIAPNPISIRKIRNGYIVSCVYDEVFTARDGVAGAVVEMMNRVEAPSVHIPITGIGGDGTTLGT